jgi:branched-chain amino acid transport system permease protein
MGDAMPALPAIVIGLVASGVLLVVLDLTIMRAVYRQEGETRVLMGLLLMLGVAFVIDGVLVWRYPIQQLSLRIGGDAVSILGVRMTTGSLLASAVTIVAGLVLVAFFRYSSLGCGVNPSAVRTFVFAVSGMLACLVAVTRSMTGPIGANNTVSFTILALIVAVVGGLGSVSGAFVAGILLGIVDRLSSFYIGTYVTSIVLLGCAALTIVLRPSGLLGRST